MVDSSSIERTAEFWAVVKRCYCNFSILAWRAFLTLNNLVAEFSAATIGSIDIFNIYIAYDLLNGIYRKEHEFEAQKRYLAYSIEFFTELREKPKDYVLSIARKYNCEYKALDCIDREDKIHYYRGAFVLYDLVKVLDKLDNK